MQLAAAVAVVLLSVPACGERSEPRAPHVDLYPVTIQTAGDRPLVVERPAKRIATLDRSSTTTVRRLGADDALVSSAAVPGQVDVESLRRAHPNLIVAMDTVDERQLSRAAQATGAQVYTAPADSIRQVERAITQLGLATGHPIEARGLVRHIQERKRYVNEKLKGVAPISVFVDTGFFTTVSDQSLLGDLIRAAHGRNVAGSSLQPGPIDLKQLHELDPDVYLATSDTGLTLEDLRRNPQVRRLRAVREGRFLVAESDLLRPGPQIGEGLVEIARLLHSDAFQ